MRIENAKNQSTMARKATSVTGPPAARAPAVSTAPQLATSERSATSALVALLSLVASWGAVDTAGALAAGGPVTLVAFLAIVLWFLAFSILILVRAPGAAPAS